VTTDQFQTKFRQRASWPTFRVVVGRLRDQQSRPAAQEPGSAFGGGRGRAEGPRRHQIEAGTKIWSLGQHLGTAELNLHLVSDSELVDRFGQKVTPLGHRVEQHNPQTWTGHRHDKTRNSSAAAKIKRPALERGEGDREQSVFHVEH